MSFGEKLRQVGGKGYAPGAFHILTLLLSGTAAVALAFGLNFLSSIQEQNKAIMQRMDNIAAEFSNYASITNSRLATVEANALSEDRSVIDHGAVLGRHSQELHDLDKRYGELAVHVNDLEQHRR